MLNRVSPKMDKREGSVIWDTHSPTAIELKILYDELENIIKEAYGDTASRQFLVLRCKERGLYPEPATNAILKGVFTPTTVDVTGKRFNLNELNYVVTEKISDGVYKATIGDTYVYKELGTDKMLPINWSLFTIPKTETIKKITITLSTTAAKLGKWQGAFGSSTGEAPDYWIMTKDMQATLTGTEDDVTWEVSSSEAKAMQSQSNGQLKFGVWWIDCGTFTIEYCTITTDAAK